MVTAYYIMNMNKNKKIFNVEEYYSSLESKPKNTYYNINSTCRVCLQNGDIPIFGAENAQEIIDALKIFGEINDLNEEDDNPKKLCNICFKFLKSAILFRFIAQRTNETLKPPSPIDSPEYIHIEDDDEELDEDFPPPVKEPKVPCPICKTMYSKNYLKQHMTIHNPKHVNQYVCDKCGKSFRLRITYYKHRIRHATDYTFMCKICPFKARYVESLQRHILSHNTRNYKHMCKKCPARFVHKGNLNHHIMMKHTEPEYKCDFCNKAFHTKINLQRHHEFVHLGIIRHVCDICNQQFGYRCALVKHQRRVHKRERLKLRFSNSIFQLSNDKE